MVDFMLRRKVMLGEAHAWPSEYTQAQYISSDGRSYFDSLVIPDTEMEFEAKWLKPSSTVAYLYGSVGDNTRAFSAYLSVNGNWRFGDTTIALTQPLNQEIISIQNKTGVWWNGTKQGAYPSISSTITGLRTLVVLGRSTTNGANAASFAGDLFYLKIRNNGVLVADFEPCQNQQGVFGMYDVVRRQWFPSETAIPFGGVI